MRALFEQPGWAVVEREYNLILDTLDRVSTLDPASPNFAEESRARIKTVKSLRMWMSDLKGRVSNALLLAPEELESMFIERR